MSRTRSLFRLRGNRRLNVAALAALALLALGACSSAPASAALSRPVMKVLDLGPTSVPWNLATDNADNLYVVDKGRQVIEKLDSNGNPVPFSGSASYISGNQLTGFPSGAFEMVSQPDIASAIAVDRTAGPTSGYIYLTGVAGSGSAGVYVFGPSGIYLGQMDAAAGETTCGVAVNQATGEVFTGDFSGQLRRYPPPVGDPATVVRSGEINPLQGLSCAVAADSDGSSYAGGREAYFVHKFTAAEYDASEPQGAPLPPAFALPPRALTIDLASHELYDDVGTEIVRYSSSGTELGAFGALNLSMGVALGAGNAYVSDAVNRPPNSTFPINHGIVYIFGPPAQLPIVTTGPSADVEQVTATIEGNVDPDSAGGVTTCEFEYGVSEEYADGSVPCSPEASVGSPFVSATPVSADLSGLTPDTTYHYRLVAKNANGLQIGRDQTFRTPVAVLDVNTGEATEVAKDSATLPGSYTGQGYDTHYYFEYGTTTSYGQTAPAPPGNDAGSGSGPQAVAPVQITELKGDTTYHFRLVATNKFGAAYGQDVTFTTPPSITNIATDPPTGVTGEEATLHGSYDGDKYEVHYYFEYGPSLSYGQTAPAPPGTAIAPGGGRVDVPPVVITGLQQGGTYHYRLVASNATGTTFGPDEVLKSAQSPTINNLSTANVTADSADLKGEVNPQFAATTYHFEWGDTPSYGNVIPVPDADAGAGGVDVPVSVHLEGLTSGVTYHFRLVAENVYGVTKSVDQTFGFYPPTCPNSQVRQETRSSHLPDCRAYELVSPQYANGAVIFPQNAPPPSGLAISPPRVAYGTAYGLFPEETGDPPNSLSDPFVSTRTGTGWYQKYVSIPATETLTIGGPPYNYIGGLSQEQTPSKTLQTTQASPTLDRFVSYNLGDASGQYGQLGEASNGPYVFDTSTGQLIERWPTNLDSITNGRDFVGVPKASPDFSHFVFSSNLVFAPGGDFVEEEIACCHNNNPGLKANSVYDNNLETGQVSLVSIKEDETTTFKGSPVEISTDGSHILMSDVPLRYSGGLYTGVGVEASLYLRVDDKRTYDIAPGHKITYAGSTADGSTIYFTSTEQLTSDDHDTSRDLFMWKESSPSTLTRVSVGIDGTGDTDACSAATNWEGLPWVEKCDIKIITIAGGYQVATGGQGGNGASDNYVASKSGDIYFESPEKLAGAKGDASRVNLFVYREGTVHYVATMGPERFCESDPTLVTYCTDNPVARIQVTENGDHMAFITPSRVTSYDNAGHSEMYTFTPSTGRITCVSCRPDGLPPVGIVRGSQNGLFLIPDGRVFFSSGDSLVPQDTNEYEDVYEFTEGKPNLISPGLGQATDGFAGLTGTQAIPGLISVSANGTDVYFATLDTLVTQDHNGQEIKIYDARTGGGFPAEKPRPNCAAADECHGPGSSPPPLAPDRTSANLGKGGKKAAAKHKKHKKHKKSQSKKKKKKAGKARAGHSKRGGHNHG